MSKPTHRPTAAAINWSAVFAFPNPVNEYAARITAGLVVLLAGATLLTGSGWGLAVIAAGFWLRVLFGPRISPAGPAVRQGPRAAAGPGTPGARTAEAFRAGHGHGGLHHGADPVRRRCRPGGLDCCWRVLIAAASLEAFAGFCLGCVIFGCPAAPGPDPGGHLRGLQQHGAQAVVTPTSRSAMPRMTSGASRASSHSSGRHPRRRKRPGCCPRWTPWSRCRRCG